VLVEVADFSFEGLSLFCGQCANDRADVFESVDNVQNSIVATFQNFKEGSDPGDGLFGAVAEEFVCQGPEVALDVVEIDALLSVSESVLG